MCPDICIYIYKNHMNADMYIHIKIIVDMHTCTHVYMHVRVFDKSDVVEESNQ